MKIKRKRVSASIRTPVTPKRSFCATAAIFYDRAATTAAGYAADATTTSDDAKATARTTPSYSFFHEGHVSELYESIKTMKLLCLLSPCVLCIGRVTVPFFASNAPLIVPDSNIILNN